jgi:peptide/nickel transport system permease protein
LAGRLRTASSEIVKALTSLFLLVVASFWLVRLTGNPIAIALGDRLSDQELEKRIRQAGLARPIGEQFLDYLAAVGRLDLGKSVFTSESVSEKIFRAFGSTFELAVPSLVFGILVAYGMAYLALRLSPSWVRSLHAQSAIVTYALPAFLLAVLGQWIFALVGVSLPVNGRLSVAGQIEYQSLPTRTGFVVLDSIANWNYKLALDALSHLVLPVIVLGALTAAALTRIFLLQIQSSLEKTYVTGARAKGLVESQVIKRYGVRPVLAQMVSISGLEVAAVITGAIYVENAFEIRGLGYLLVESVLARDYSLVQGLVLVLGVVIIAVNFVTSAWSRRLDPRIETK